MAEEEDIPLDVQGYLSITGTFYFLLFDLSLTPFYLPKTPSSQFLFCSVVAHSPALFRHYSCFPLSPFLSFALWVLRHGAVLSLPP